MINDYELQISNRSYTRKDFAQIYPELLSLAKTLTNRWNPQESNETDPAIVLLKLAAFIGDKNNYNIDKNLLEMFMPSATQRTSMQNLCEMNGYSMKYFNSATTNITIVYNGTALHTTSGDSFTLPRFTTVVSDPGKAIAYTLTKDCVISRPNVSHIIPAIEGRVETLTIGESSTVQLYNLDDNFRLYLPVSYVAENGIFINNVGSTELWERSTNLNTEHLGRRVFKFGFESSNSQPYIQFPSDIAKLIESGLTVRYTVSSGANGNVSRGTLSQLIDTTKFALDNDPSVMIDTAGSLYITNMSAATDGTNPESVEDAYNNFKKVVGTFNTLVTCRDYANFIYNMYNEALRSPYVSNVQVADRRMDINYANSFMSFNQYGAQRQNINNEGNDITPYDLCLYPLQAGSVNDLTSYNKSFTVSKDIALIWDALQNDYETINMLSHDLKVLKPDDIYCIKNYYELKNIRIYTYSKVNRAEQADIIKHIKLALYTKFQARNIDYGYELPYDVIRDTILGADTRIKTIDFPEPIVTPWVMLANGEEIELTSNSDVYKKLALKNVLQGKIELFDNLEEFAVEFGQTNTSTGQPVYTGIKYIDAEAKLPTTHSEESEKYAPANNNLQEGYKLRKNEVLQVSMPHLAVDITYPENVGYYYMPDLTTGTPCVPKEIPNLNLKSDYDAALLTKTQDWYVAVETIPGATGGYLIDKDGTLYRKVDTDREDCIYLNQPIFETDENGNEVIVRTLVTYYTMDFVGEDNSAISLKANVDHQLVGNEMLFVYFTNSSGNSQVTKYFSNRTESNNSVEYTDCNIITPNFDLSRTTLSASSGRSITRDNITYLLLSEGQQIDHKQLSSTSLTNHKLYCYWITHRPGNRLFTPTDYENIVLESGEYFIYADVALSKLSILGGGTRLSLQRAPQGAAENIWVLPDAEPISIEAIYELGLDAFSEDSWYLAQLSTNNLKLETLDTYTFSDGCVVQIVDQDGLAVDNETIKAQVGEYIGNKPITLGDATHRYGIKYTDSIGITGIINASTVSNTDLEINSRLLLNVGPAVAQSLLYGQKIVLATGNDDSATKYELVADYDPEVQHNTYFELSKRIQTISGNNMKLTTDDEDELGTTCTAFIYNKDVIKYNEDTTDFTSQPLTPSATGELLVSGAHILGNENAISLPIITVPDALYQLVMVYWNTTSSGEIPVEKQVVLRAKTAAGTDSDALTDFNTAPGTFSAKLSLKPGINMIQIDNKSTDLNKLELVYESATAEQKADITDTIIIGKPAVILGINPNLDLPETELAWLIEGIQKASTVDGRVLFDFTASVDNAYAINRDSLSSADAYWDTNNIANRFTIAQIDFAGSNFEIAKSSRV